MRHLLSLFDLSAEEIRKLFVEAGHLKAAHQRRIPTPMLIGRVLAMVFEKPSLRTRVSFQAAMAQMGGSSIFMLGSEVGLGSRETVEDVARTVGQYADAVVLRTFAQQTIEDFAAHAGCPVINGLSDLHHPCQALADVFTMAELFGEVEGRTLAFIGDGNNVARSLALCCAKVGVRFILAAPSGYQLDRPFLQKLKKEVPGAKVETVQDPKQAVKAADVIYTDVWTSMGQEGERDERNAKFAAYQVNAALVALAPAHAKVMHCLPAHRGEEITSDVLDSERSVVFQQAGNRMHAQKALLQWFVGGTW